MNLRFLLVAVIAGINSYNAAQAADFRATAEMINDTIRANHYHPAELDNDAYRQIEKDVIALGGKAVSADEFLAGFNAIWQKGNRFRMWGFGRPKSRRWSVMRASKRSLPAMGR